MKKKAASFLTLTIVLLLGCAIGASATSVTSAASSIKSAVYSPATVYFYDEEIPLQDSLVLITAGDEKKGKLYMPVRELLEYMNFRVEWDKKENAIYLTMNGCDYYDDDCYDYYDGCDGTANNSDAFAQKEADETALDIMRRTGNWSYIEPYLPYMSRKGIDAVVASYNSKHRNSREHKRASNYYNH